jgi:hypothetical protein
MTHSISCSIVQVIKFALMGYAPAVNGEPLARLL